MSDRVPLAAPDLGPDEAAHLAAVVGSGRLVQGPFVARFEAALAARTGRRHAVAVSSGTAALELALRLLGVGPGDEVIVPALTWPSPAHAAAWVGATPVLVDVDPAEWNATPEAFAAARTPRTRAAIAIHQFGFPARVPALLDALPGVPVVEDAACALGASLDGRPAGGLGGVVGCLSFHPRKTVTTGEGGALLLDDDALADRARVLRNHGQRAPGDFVEAGPNLRLGELGAAIGLGQVERLDGLLAARRRLADRYRGALPEVCVPQAAAPGAAPSHQTCGVRLAADLGPGARDRLVAALAARGIEAGRLSYALHRLPSLRGARVPAPLPGAEALDDRGLALPLFATMTDAQQDRVLAALEAALPEVTG